MDKINKLLDAFRSEDDLGVVIRSQIIVEQYLNSLIESFMNYPEHFRKMKIDYSDTVMLALSFGLHPRFKPTLNALGKIRNDFAHKLRPSIKKQDVNNLYDTLDTKDKEVLHSSIKDVNTEFQTLQPFKESNEKDQFILIVMVVAASLDSAIKLLPNPKMKADD
jgi:hypothetical protein